MSQILQTQTTTAHARIFERDPTGPLKDYSFTVLGNGRLAGERFFTTTGDESPADEASHEFVYDPTDARFRETSLFVNATEMMAWFEENGFEIDADPVEIQVNAMIRGTVNNAIYTPAYAGQTAQIRIGNGDGFVLRNLSTDADVVASLVGHHIQWKLLGYDSAADTAVRSGIAEAFVALKNDDPCFAKTICVQLRDWCVIDRCFRNADNRYKKYEVPGGAWEGQLFSGLLWDLRKHHMTREQVIVFLRQTLVHMRALKQDPYWWQNGERLFVHAMILADRDLHGGQHEEVIEDLARERWIR